MPVAMQFVDGRGFGVFDLSKVSKDFLELI